MVDFSLDDRVAIVTGAALGGIGEVYAKTLAGAGAAVVCADIDQDRALPVSTAIGAVGGTAVAMQVDIADEGSVDSMVQEVCKQFGGIDILVNNAALMAEIAETPALECTRAEWDRAFSVNLAGAWQCSKAVAPQMRQRGGGRIVNQSSAGAFPADSVYGITKLAVVGLTTTLAVELGPHNIAVNCIAPGITNSEAGRSLIPEGSEYLEMVQRRVALRAVGEREDLCGTLLLLCSPAGAWITGQVISVDGGLVMRS